MSGDAGKGEELLRQASTSSEANPKVRQNLALVLGLQGKYDEFDESRLGGSVAGEGAGGDRPPEEDGQARCEVIGAGGAAFGRMGHSSGRGPARAQRRMKPTVEDTVEREPSRNRRKSPLRRVDVQALGAVIQLGAFLPPFRPLDRTRALTPVPMGWGLSVRAGVGDVPRATRVPSALFGKGYGIFQKLMAAGPRMTKNSTGRKKMIMGTASFGGSDAALRSASDMRMSRFSFAMMRSACPTGVP